MPRAAPLLLLAGPFAHLSPYVSLQSNGSALMCGVRLTSRPMGAHVRPTSLTTTASASAFYAPASLSLKGARLPSVARSGSSTHVRSRQRSRVALSAPSMVQSPERQSVSIKDLSKQMQTARMDMEQDEVDERVRVLMEGMRGKSLNDDDFAAADTTMRVIEFDSKNDLPLEYDYQALKDYYKARPKLWITRLLQVAAAGSQFLVPTVVDALTGQLEKNSVARTRALREVLTSLGPFFIKLGQALAIRPDILSPSAMYELQRLCDKVPAFDNELARQTVRDELGTSIESVFSEFSPRPIAAASLGQVCVCVALWVCLRARVLRVCPRVWCASAAGDGKAAAELRPRRVARAGGLALYMHVQSCRCSVNPPRPPGDECLPL